MSAIDQLENLAETAVPLLLKYGPELLPLAQLLDDGKLTRDQVKQLVELTLSLVSDAKMHAELG